MARRGDLLLAAALAVGVVAVTPACASPYTVTYTGTVVGTDSNGVFGAAGTVLTSATFTAQYTYDPSLFGNAQYINGGNELYVFGGTAYPVTDPVTAAWITIDGVTHLENGHYGAQVDVGSVYFGEEESNSANDDLDNFFYTRSFPTVAQSYTAVQSFSSQTANGQGDFTYFGEHLYLEANSVSVVSGAASPPAPQVTPVAEPASLAIFAGGLAVFVGLTRQLRGKAHGRRGWAAAPRHAALSAA